MGLVRTDGWLRPVATSQRAARRIRRAVDRGHHTTDRDPWLAVLDRLDPLLEEIGAVATAGAEVDRAVERLGPDALTARLATFEEQAAAEPTPELAEAIHAVRRELEQRRDLLNRAGQARVRLHRSVARLDDLARRLDDGHLPGDPRRAATGLDRSVAELAAVRAALDDVRES